MKFCWTRPFHWLISTQAGGASLALYAAVFVASLAGNGQQLALNPWAAELGQSRRIVEMMAGGDAGALVAALLASAQRALPRGSALAAPSPFFAALGVLLVLACAALRALEPDAALRGGGDAPAAATNPLRDGADDDAEEILGDAEEGDQAAEADAHAQHRRLVRDEEVVEERLRRRRGARAQLWVHAGLDLVLVSDPVAVAVATVRIGPVLLLLAVGEAVAVGVALERVAEGGPGTDLLGVAQPVAVRVGLSGVRAVLLHLRAIREAVAHKGRRWPWPEKSEAPLQVSK